jgi:hypothetical protein
MQLGQNDTVTDSAGHPDPYLVKGAGHKAIIRYFSHDPTKDLTVPELASALDAGLGVSVVWETTALRPLSGSSGGTADGAEFANRLRAVGWPANVHVAVAFDSNFSGFVWRPIARSYGQAFAAAFRAGGYDPAFLLGYGGNTLVADLVAAGTFGGLWQASATSWSQTYPDPNAHVVQLLQQQNLGTTVDINRVQRPLTFYSKGSPLPTPVPTEDDDVKFYLVNDGTATWQAFGPGVGRRHVPTVDVLNKLISTWGTQLLMPPAGSTTQAQYGYPQVWVVAPGDLDAVFGHDLELPADLVPVLGAINTLNGKVDVLSSNVAKIPAAPTKINLTGTLA